MAAKATEHGGAVYKREPAPDFLATSLTTNPVLLVALPETAAGGGVNTTVISTFVPKPTEPAFADPLTKERRHRLMELTREAGF